MRSKIITALLLSISITALGSYGFAQDKDKNNGKELRAAVDRVDKASDVINEVMKVAEKSIPADFDGVVLSLSEAGLLTRRLSGFAF